MNAIEHSTAQRPKGKPWTFAEAAEHLGVSVKHVRYLADTNRITTFRVGKRARRISDQEMTRVSREGV